MELRILMFLLASNSNECYIYDHAFIAGLICKIYILWMYFAGDQFQRKRVAWIKKWLQFEDWRVNVHKRVNRIKFYGIRGGVRALLLVIPFTINYRKYLCTKYIQKYRPARTLHFRSYPYWIAAEYYSLKCYILIMNLFLLPPVQTGEDLSELFMFFWPNKLKAFF